MKKDNKVLTHVSKRLEEIMCEKKIKGAKLAKSVGISKNSLSAILQGNVNMSISTFCGLCSALGVHPGEVLPPVSAAQQVEAEFDTLKFKYMSLPVAMRKNVFVAVKAAWERLADT